MIKGKKVILGLLCLLFSISTYGNVSIISLNDSSFKVDTAQLIIKSSMSYVGTPYKWGKSDPKVGFDCSGFTKFVFGGFGITLPRTANGQYNVGDYIRPNEWEIGDLVFFKGKKSKGIGHVGMVTKVDTISNNFYFIHSCNSGVRIDNSQNSYYKQRYVGAKRIL